MFPVLSRQAVEHKGEGDDLRLSASHIQAKLPKSEGFRSESGNSGSAVDLSAFVRLIGTNRIQRLSQPGHLHHNWDNKWQVIPTALGEMLNDEDDEKSQRVMQAMLHMDKIDIQGLQQAYA